MTRLPGNIRLGNFEININFQLPELENALVINLLDLDLKYFIDFLNFKF